MSVEDRSWMKERQHPEINEERPAVVVWLIGINAAIFLIGFLGKGNLLESLGCFSVYTAFYRDELWRLITYQFLHANLGHIALNMMGLWVFGRVVEQQFGHARFLLYYLVCGIAAALFYTLLGSMGLFHPAAELAGSFTAEEQNHIWKIIPLVGASGSIYGVIAACAVLHPHARIQLIFPPINMSVRNFAIGILCVAALVIAFNWNNAGGEAGHMGGMLAGFFIMLVIKAVQLIRARRVHGNQPRY